MREILKKYDETMQGIGKLKDVEIKLDIDSTVKPVVQPTRRIPFHIRKQVEQEINSLIKQDIIEKVPANEARSWISQIVAVPKKENTAALTCAVLILPFEESGIQCQQLMNLFMIYITTFAMHMGLYRYKRFNYGTNAVQKFLNISYKKH